VKVLEVDDKRRRIALSMRLDDSAPRLREGGADSRRDVRPPKPQRQPEPQGNGAMAEALARAFKRR
jgi:uncharacterized protein